LVGSPGGEIVGGETNREDGFSASVAKDANDRLVVAIVGYLIY
jgi:hypothetical protein